MDFNDAREKLRRKNEILFSRESECLQELLAMIREESHPVMILWALECLKAPLEKLKERYPQDKRAETAVVLSKEWASGKIKMPIAKRAILDCHAAAKEAKSKADEALFHAVGQGCATVHVITHAIGLAFYELTAIVREHGMDEALLEEKIKFYTETLIECEKLASEEQHEWAAFITKDKPNLEQKMYEKSLGK